MTEPLRARCRTCKKTRQFFFKFVDQDKDLPGEDLCCKFYCETCFASDWFYLSRIDAEQFERQNECGDYVVGAEVPATTPIDLTKDQIDQMAFVCVHVLAGAPIQIYRRARKIFTKNDVGIAVLSCRECGDGEKILEHWKLIHAHHIDDILAGREMPPCNHALLIDGETAVEPN